MKVKDIKAVRLTPKDLADSPEGFEKRYDKRNTAVKFREPRPKLRPIQNESMADRMERFNLNGER
jgi:hypothetical protein